MENLLLTPEEQKLLLKFRSILEREFEVIISLPEYESPCGRDIVVATVLGGNVNLVKNFIQKRLHEKKKQHEQRIDVQNNVTTITLSDSDSDSSFPVLMELQARGKKRKRKNNACHKKEEPDGFVDLSSTILIEDSDDSESENSAQKKTNNSEEGSSLKLGEIDVEASSSSEVNIELLMASSDFTPLINAQISERNCEGNKEDLIILRDSPPPNYISLCPGKEKENIPNRNDDSVIIIEDEIPRLLPNTAAISRIPPIVPKPRRLRPIVIDGSNVAREHGKTSNTYSCKGIEIAINYFLQRGHHPVTAFVPQYRRHNKFGPILTTDQPLLEILARDQRVVFTPSRRIDNKRVTCYDDRFIVELATQTGGVILSNDNYRDLAAENEVFKKTVNERLLMFCFVGDLIMVPQDPLGRYGPSLENFLSFPD